MTNPTNKDKENFDNPDNIMEDVKVKIESPTVKEKLDSSDQFSQRSPSQQSSKTTLNSQNIIHNDAEKEKEEGSFGYKDGDLYKFMFRYALKYKKQLIIIIFFMLCFSLSTALAPILIQLLIDKFTLNTTAFFNIPWLDSIFYWVIQGVANIFSVSTNNRIWIEVSLVAICYLGLQLFSYFFSYQRTLRMSKLGLFASRDIASDVFSHVQELDMGYHDRNEVGRIFSRLSTDIIAIREFLGGQVINNLANVVTVVMVLGFIISIDPWLGLVSLSIIPLIIIGGILGRQKIRVHRKESRRLNSKMIAYIGESIAGIKVTKQMNRENQNIGTFKPLTLDVKDATLKANTVGGILFPYMIFASTIGTSLIILVGVYRIMAGLLTIGSLLAFLNYNAILFRPIVILGNLYQQLQDALTGAERVKALSDTPSTTPWRTNMPKLHEIEGKVEFKDLDFSYFKNTPIYQNFNLTVPAGKVFALVGKTGAGKTSIINILNQLYPFQQGSLLVDEHNLLNYSLASYRKQIVAIPQDFFIFSGSIRHNLMLGDPNATEEQMWNVLEQVGLSDMVKRFDKGFDTFLQDRGRKLSMGQRQLLVFAAALLANPKILILDEATSSIDVFNEIKIQKATKFLLQNRTAFIIAHRLSTIRDADQIVVVDQAHIVEKGTHEELLQKRGKYFKLVQNQINLTQ